MPKEPKFNSYFEQIIAVLLQIVLPFLLLHNKTESLNFLLGIELGSSRIVSNNSNTEQRSSFIAKSSIMHNKLLMA